MLLLRPHVLYTQVAMAYRAVYHDVKGFLLSHRQEHQHTATGIIKRNDHTFVKAGKQRTDIREAPSMRDA